MSKNIETTWRTVDNLTGEVIEDRTAAIKVKKVTDEPNFIKMYIEHIISWNNCGKASGTLLPAILMYMNYENEIVLNKHIKEKIGKKINMSITHIDKCLSNLVKAGVLIRPKNSRGMFIANPMFFGKGEWVNIKKIRTEYEFSENGCFVKTDIER